MKSNIHIGTCGFRGNKIEYSDLLSYVEIQQTFYQPPQIKTLERWRAELPDDFEFTVKAWQLITHEAKSPTYRRLKKKLSEEEAEAAGYFKPSEIVREAWDVTLACAEALKAKTILFQCPASFKPYTENIEHLERFFAGIERGNLNFVWEPRGEGWTDKIVSGICERHDLWHVVDPFKKRTVTPEKCYYRLHGVTGWRYKYEEDELQELVSLLPEKGDAYVFFNNIYMTEDAVRFQEIVRESKGQ
jgi:uncharacterized protein YecE (DUF72 family)